MVRAHRVCALGVGVRVYSVCTLDVCVCSEGSSVRVHTVCVWGGRPWPLSSVLKAGGDKQWDGEVTARMPVCVCVCACVRVHMCTCVSERARPVPLGAQDWR